MLKKLLIILVITLAGFAGLASMQPEEFRVERSATVAAPASVVFEQVNNLTKWNSWSPWAKIDPNAKQALEGPEAGKGAIMRWDGKGMGAGSMTIIESQTDDFLQFQMDFTRPIKSTSTVEFSFKPEGEQTVVTWRMYGKNNFINKAVSLIFNCEKITGEQFDKGLANIKAVVEKKV